MSSLFTTIFRAASIVRDREFGFRKDMPAAPVSRALIVIGKYLGHLSKELLRQSIILILTGATVSGKAIRFAR
jgi:ABC-2 type transport system permease protein